MVHVSNVFKIESIPTILSYTVSKLVHVLRHSVVLFFETQCSVVYTLLAEQLWFRRTFVGPIGLADKVTVSVS